MSAAQNGLLELAVAEIEAHVAASGWDRWPALFALAPTDDSPLTPVEQEALPEGPLDETLAQIAWPAVVTGCALSQEIVILPPSAESDLPEGSDGVQAAANHPDRREARLVVAVLRTGDAAAMLRLRGQDGADDGDLLTGSDLAPNLVQALLATLEQD